MSSSDWSGLYDRYSGLQSIVFWVGVSDPDERNGNTSAGNHIDYMHFGKCMNEDQRYVGHRSPGRTAHYFRVASEVWVARLGQS